MTPGPARAPSRPPLAQREQARRTLAAAQAEFHRRALAKRRAIDHLADFVRQAWDIVEPGTPLVWNWHLDIICDALERQARGEEEFRRLAIFIPPGAMKSLLVSVFAPAWRWLFDPEHRSIFVANSDDLVERDSRRTRQIVTSDWYRALLAFHCAATKGPDGAPIPAWTLAFDQNQKTNFENTARGFRQCLSIGAAITGKRADAIAIDDPIDAKLAINGTPDQIRAALNKVNTTIRTTLPSRVNDLATAEWTMIMQRLHVDDPAAWAIRRGWKVINISMEFEPGDPLNHPDDPRTTAGELMFPAKFPQKQLDDLRNSEMLGEAQYCAQYLQKPIPATGLRFQAHWFKTYAQSREWLILHADEVAITVDAAQKAGRANDFCSLQVWVRIGRDYYLVDQILRRMEYPELESEFRRLCRRYPTALLKLIEDKSHGTTLLQTCAAEVGGMVPFDPGTIGSKETRAQYTQRAAEAGHVWVPDPNAPQYEAVAGWVDQHTAFPLGRNDDQVDATSQLLCRWEIEATQSAANRVANEAAVVDQLANGAFW